MPFDIAWVRSQLPNRRVDWYDSIGSTMTGALDLARAGAATGTAVAADQQTAGQGRHGRSWHSPPGDGLYVSVVLKAAEHFPALTLASGLATREAIALVTGIECDVRWPNDLLIANRKCAGILTVTEGSAAIVGIGINVNQEAFPPDLAGMATSLRIAAGRTHSREQLLVQLLTALDRWKMALAVNGLTPILGAFSAVSSYVRGRRVSAEEGITGVTAGLDPHGFLLVRRDNGEVVKILAGGVRPL
jgi:BirA family biotin operon repressor/biotin-[acetyl-CoA-carboxylase] ligase